jgi:hypothetical protein
MIDGIHHHLSINGFFNGFFRPQYLQLPEIVLSCLQPEVQNRRDEKDQYENRDFLHALPVLRENTIPEIQETTLCQSHTDQINDQYERKDNCITETFGFMF